VPTKSGTLAVKPGRVLGFLDSLAVRVYGRGAHGATPQLAIDPIMLAASILTRLQTVVARGMDPKDRVVVSWGLISAGTDASIIPNFADFTLDVRSFS
jgi:metal-dependent amidase/aminoacylase/carboxypeptidase family protein